jgi:hypothetical protein
VTKVNDEWHNWRISNTLWNQLSLTCSQCNPETRKPIHPDEFSPGAGSGPHRRLMNVIRTVFFSGENWDNPYERLASCFLADSERSATKPITYSPRTERVSKLIIRDFKGGKAKGHGDVRPSQGHTNPVAMYWLRLLPTISCP